MALPDGMASIKAVPAEILRTLRRFITSSLVVRRDTRNMFAQNVSQQCLCLVASSAHPVPFRNHNCKCICMLRRMASALGVRNPSLVWMNFETGARRRHVRCR